MSNEDAVQNSVPEEVSDGVEENATASESGAVEATQDVTALQEQLSELQDKLTRTWADFDNYRRRVQKDQEEARRYESLRLTHDLLPGLDSLSRAITTAEQTGDQQALLEGIRMVAQQFRDILKGHSAVPIEPQGQPFDPNLHEALTQVPSADHEPM
ncbi:MAG: nucleotide exchange factor GrpE, partial [Planctomycetaceae bacterium]